MKVRAVFPYGSDWVPAGMAFIASLLDDGREVRLRAIKLNKLHRNPRTQYGQPRRQGYLLETVFPDVVTVNRDAGVLHHARPVPSNSYPDMYLTACGMRGRLWQLLDGQHVTCAACATLSEEIVR